jgi:predicted ATPase
VLTRLDLRHFKCFERLQLPLGRLTLLSGTNASGKSSIMQALALLHQTIREHEWSTRLMLNGVAVRLGIALDVIDQEHGRRAFELGLIDEETRYLWRFIGERHEMSMAVTYVNAGGEERRNPDALHRLMPAGRGGEALARRLEGLSYLTAERLGPREVYALEDPQMTPVVGPRGEYAVSLLHSGRDENVLPGLIVEDAPPTRLHQVTRRMEQFFPDCGLDIKRIPDANAVTLGLRTSKSTSFLRPIHTGFGLTQVLPLLVAAVSADLEDLLLVENPEVHLHPSGQAAMGEFLAEVAAAGVQVLTETHSDHVLNGVRRAVKKGILPPDDAVLHFFRPRGEAGDERSQVESPTLDSQGRVDAWPNGFFDQFDKDMNYFAGW